MYKDAPNCTVTVLARVLNACITFSLAQYYHYKLEFENNKWFFSTAMAGFKVGSTWENSCNAMALALS